MSNKLDSTGDRARARAYYRDFWPGIIAYVAVLGAVLAWGGLDGPSGWRYVWAVLPVLPGLWIVRAVVRQLRRCDEYQRVLLLQSMAAGFGVAMVAAVTVGFLALAGLDLPHGFAGWTVYITGMIGWGIGAFAGRR
jgi:hypothetical protein